MSATPDLITKPGRARSLSALDISKSFGTFKANDRVSIDVPAGQFHTLLGENGAGKSTLVKCLMGFQSPDSGQVSVDGREVEIRNPRDAQRLGIGMVYQHFTLAPALSAAENLIVSRSDAPAVIDWKSENANLTAFMERMPFKVPLHVPVGSLAAGERQKLEILKLLYLDQRFLILDEPTSVLTPAEADEVLGLLRTMAGRGEISVLMISHKFREVLAFSDAVTVLRHGRRVGGGPIGDMTVQTMASMMIGETVVRPQAERTQSSATPESVLKVSGLLAEDDSGAPLLDNVDLTVHAGEILGIAGVSGNGQSALMEVLTGQRIARDGRIEIRGQRFAPTRADFDRFGFRSLPEEPMRNGAAPRMSVAENLAFRDFDKPPLASRLGWLSPVAIYRKSLDMIARYRVKTTSPDAPLSSLSGGNVQRALLARELGGQVNVLAVANPCFGLDFASVADIRAQIVEQRNRGAAVLLISEDLDEILELSDRVAVMSAGHISYVAAIGETDRTTIGRYMAGAH